MHSERTEDLPLSRLFQSMKRGNYHAVAELEPGAIPLVSCAETNYGIEGYYDIPEANTHSGVVTISSGGLPLTSFYHPYRVGVKDDTIICVPKPGIAVPTLLYVVAHLNRMRWRFSFGRKCYDNRIGTVRIPFPIDRDGTIDQDRIASDLGMA